MKTACAVGVFVIFASSLGAVSIGTIPVRADELNLKYCPNFTSRQWVNTYPPHNSGTQYAVTTSGKGTVTCAQAVAFAKKFVVEKIAAGQGLETKPVKGGPVGWTCTSFEDWNGYAYQGHCTKPTTNKGALPPLFSWSPTQK